MQSALVLNLAKEATMSFFRIRLGWAIAVVVVLAAALVPVAGARTSGVEPKNPWYAYDAALRKAQHQRHQQSVGYRFITDTLGGSGGGGGGSVASKTE
jgi:hypothetical protein